MKKFIMVLAFASLWTIHFFAGSESLSFAPIPVRPKRLSSKKWRKIEAQRTLFAELSLIRAPKPLRATPQKKCRIIAIQSDMLS